RPKEGGCARRQHPGAPEMKPALAISLASMFAVMLTAQTPALTAEGSEERDLSQAVGEAGGSAIDLIRGLEQFLKKYPATKRRPEIEKALAKAAIDSDDDARIVLYGEKVIQATPAGPPAGSPPDDTQLLDRLTRTLLDSSDPAGKKH